MFKVVMSFEGTAISKELKQLMDDFNWEGYPGAKDMIIDFTTEIDKFPTDSELTFITEELMKGINADVKHPLHFFRMRFNGYKSVVQS